MNQERLWSLTEHCFITALFLVMGEELLASLSQLRIGGWKGLSEREGEEREALAVLQLVSVSATAWDPGI